MKTKSVIAIVLIVLAVAAGLRFVGGPLKTALAVGDDSNYSVGNATITDPVRALDIDWTSGSVTIAYHADAAIELTETAAAPLSGDQQMRWWLDGDTLRVLYEKPGFSLGDLFNSPKKDLTITLPEGCSLDSVKIDATSAEVTIPALTADELSLNVTSGAIDAVCDAARIDIDATSGDITLTATRPGADIDLGGTSGNIHVTADDASAVLLHSTSGTLQADIGAVGVLKANSTSGGVALTVGASERVEVGTTSGDVKVSLSAPKALDIDTTSGSVVVGLPDEPGFTAHLDTTSGAINYDLPLARQGDTYVLGDGSAQVNIDTTSGSISVVGLKN